MEARERVNLSVAVQPTLTLQVSLSAFGPFEALTQYDINGRMTGCSSGEWAGLRVPVCQF